MHVGATWLGLAYPASAFKIPLRTDVSGDGAAQLFGLTTAGSEDVTYVHVLNFADTL